MSYQPIENYGIIGDLHTVALVGMNGAVDFMCFPHFDSPTIFAALLDHEKGGRFELAPLGKEAKHKQIYLPDSNILISRFLFEDGVAEISDFMPVNAGEHAHDLVRRAKTIRGEISYRMACQPRFDYGRTRHRVEMEADGAVLFVPEKSELPALRLRASIPLKIENGAATAEFALPANATASFVLEEARLGQTSRAAAPDYVSRSFKETLNFWRRWIGHSQYQGRWREIVNRSALTLKLLTYKPTGAIVAAPTFGLPEELGGERNWDYRYTWIRDASFTLYGLIRLGYTEEAAQFMKWITARCEELEPDGSLQIMYGIDGRHKLTEETLAHFEGYKKSSPVRIGNGAYNQLQLDIYGELMDAIYLYDKYGQPISFELWRNVTRLLDWVCKNWRQKDEGCGRCAAASRSFFFRESCVGWRWIAAFASRSNAPSRRR